MGIKLFNLVAFLDFPNIIRLNESNPDSRTSHFTAVWRLKKNYRLLFPHASEWESVFLGPMASCDGTIPLFGHYGNWHQWSARKPR